MVTTVSQKVVYGLGMCHRDLIPCTAKMNGAGKDDLGTLRSFTARVVYTKQLALMCKKVDKVYLSKK